MGLRRFTSIRASSASAPKSTWDRLRRGGGSGLDLLKPDAHEDILVLHGLLDLDVLEAWADEQGHIRVQRGPRGDTDVQARGQRLRAIPGIERPTPARRTRPAGSGPLNLKP
jgi:hypothetical protein